MEEIQEIIVCVVMMISHPGYMALEGVTSAGEYPGASSRTSERNKNVKSGQAAGGNVIGLKMEPLYKYSASYQRVTYARSIQLK